MTADEIGDVVADMLTAQLTRRPSTLLRHLNRILSGQRGDGLHVALTLAATIAEDQVLKPGRDFHQLTVAVTEADGTSRPGTADDLTPPARVFCQMVVALANGDQAMATDLYIGFVGDLGRNAAHVLLVGVGMAARHVTSLGCTCPPGTHQ